MTGIDCGLRLDHLQGKDEPANWRWVLQVPQEMDRLNSLKGENGAATGYQMAIAGAQIFKQTFLQSSRPLVYNTSVIP